MAVFWGLIFSHFLADFTFQTNYIAQWKARNIWGRWVHVLIFLLITYILTFPSLGMTWITLRSIPIAGWLCVMLITLLHLAEDQLRIWLVQNKKLPDNTLFLVWDQFVHIMLIFLLAPRDSAPYIFSNVWFQVGTLFVIDTHGVAILIYYLEKDVFGHAWTLIKGKYFAITERIILFLCFFLPGWGWVIAVACWIAYFIYRKIRQMNDRTWIDLILSYSITILTGFIARMIVF